MYLTGLDSPESVKSQVERLCNGVINTLVENLVGIYLHGSLSMGCFHPEQSDLDLLVVTAESMAVETRREMAEGLLRLSGDPRPVEITFVNRQALFSGVYPVPFDLHYSEAWRKQMQADLENGRWRHWNDVQRQDPDLAGQIAVTRERGICLYGEPIRQTLPAVPEEALRDCFLEECHWALDRIVDYPVYGILNSCRAWAYFIDGRFLSKSEGGEWALQRLPEPCREVVERALAVYQRTTPTGAFDTPTLNSFAISMADLVRQAATTGPTEKRVQRKR